ncbi:P-loop containing nucleoside triphosphate hydrolase protein [Lineolata rhizophorae]|uniref:RNA helicase n=1 Tax=Lineolata rhizophorae TaxID=578093 RepID=A0A6A6P585_9PEZI|nr:P-loop containing nucleoside triphosphate hydrolase protein [Lineolata rhizophorae]
MADPDGSDAFVPALHKPPSLLPIARHRDSLLYLIESFPVTIVIGQTGSGKTTQIPQFLEKAGWCVDGKVIAVTQPRRVAAVTVAGRVAEEMRCNVGREVGYSIRFEDVTSEVTRIKFLTDGLLLREALADPLLSRYSVIMVDEAHERSLSSDVLLGLLKKIRTKRSDLRIVVSSATLQAEDFLRFFVEDDNDDKSDKTPNDGGGETATNNSNSNDPQTEIGGFIGRIISLEGRAYPVDIHYLEKPTHDYLERAIQTVLDIHKYEARAGDVLVFLTGREEIETACSRITTLSAELNPSLPSLQPLPLYAGLPPDQQMYVFSPAAENTRKVIFATNIAEASVTIDGITHVVDPGFAKQRAYNPTTGIAVLTSTPISRASAVQRAGRAGRTQPGKCYRLYPEHVFEHVLPATSPPEICRSDLAPVILQLKALGFDNVARFPFVTAPPAALVTRALEMLYALGALDAAARLTKPLGMRMAELGAVEPMLARGLLGADKLGVLSEMLSVAAMVSVAGQGGGGGVWLELGKKDEEAMRRRFAAEEGDHLTLLNAYFAFVTKGKKDQGWCRNNGLSFKAMSRAVSVRNQLRKYLEKLGIHVDESLAGQHDVMRVGGGMNKGEQIRRCLTMGFFAHAARMQPDGSFRTVDESTVLWAHPSSLMFNRKADWVIFHEITETANRTFIKDITKIEKGWLLEYAPEFYRVT